MQLKGDNVLIEPDREDKERREIVLPDTVKGERWETGLVKAVGPGRKPGTMMLIPGQKVMFPKYSGMEVVDGAERYLVMSQNDVACEVVETKEKGE